MKNQLQWGRKWDPTQKYGPEYCCPNQECNWRPESGKTFGEYTIGIDSEGPPSKQSNMIAVQIIECPKDGTLFWVHINRDKLRNYKELYPEKFKDLSIKPENQERIKLR